MSDNLYMYVSLSLFVAGVYTYIKSTVLIRNIFFYVVVFTSIILYSIYGISDYFTGDGIDDSVIYHLRYGLGGAGFSEFLGLIVTSTVLIIFSLSFLAWVLFKRAKRNAHWIGKSYVSHTLILVSLLSNPAVSDVYSLLSYKSSTD